MTPVAFGPDVLPLCLAAMSAHRPQCLEGDRGITSVSDSAWNLLCFLAVPGLFPSPGPAAQSAAQPPAPEDAHPIQGVSSWSHHRHR